MSSGEGVAVVGSGSEEVPSFSAESDEWEVVHLGASASHVRHGRSRVMMVIPPLRQRKKKEWCLFVLMSFVLFSVSVSSAFF